MNANQLQPKTIQSIKVVIHDKLNPQTNYALFFESMHDATKAIESIDIDKVYLNIFRTPIGLENVSEWKGDPKPGDVYKLVGIQAGNVYTKRFFLCLYNDPTLNDTRIAQFEVRVSAKPTAVFHSTSSMDYRGFSVEIHEVDDNGETTIPLRFANYVALPQNANPSFNTILDHYIDTFASLHSTEFLNTVSDQSEEGKSECCNGSCKDHACGDDCTCHHS